MVTLHVKGESVHSISHAMFAIFFHIRFDWLLNKSSLYLFFEIIILQRRILDRVKPL